MPRGDGDRLTSEPDFKTGVTPSGVFYRVQGAGPVLLIVQGGAADANGCEPLVEQLASSFTVVTFDRRGLSRSAAPVMPVTLSAHADDTLEVLDAVTTEPAHVLGVSIGGVIALDLTIRHPERVKRLVVVEPPLGAVMKEADRAQMIAFQQETENTLREKGVIAAMRKFIARLGVDARDVEPGLPRMLPGPEVATNFSFFLTHDAPAVRTHRVNVAALKAVGAKVVPAFGVSSKGTLNATPSIALGELLGCDVLELPGGHGGYTSHPRAFAAKLREVFRA